MASPRPPGRVPDADVGSSKGYGFSGEQRPLAVDLVGQRRAQSPVAALFFAATNVDALQDAIRYRVHVESKRVISRQSDAELGLVMRSIFLQDATNRATDVVGEVRQLNTAVLDFCVPRVLQEVNQYVRYRHDAATLPMPMAWGEYATMKGSKSLEAKSFF